MPYATAEQVRGVLARDPRRRAGTAASLPDTVIDEQVAAAGRTVDAALASAGYAVPFPDGAVPLLVTDVTVAIAAYGSDLVFRQGKAHESRLDPVVARYNAATAMLDGWASGRRALPGAPPPASAGTGGGVLGEPINPCSVGLADGLLDPPHPGGYPMDADYVPDWYRPEHWT